MNLISMTIRKLRVFRIGNAAVVESEVSEAVAAAEASQPMRGDQQPNRWAVLVRWRRVVRIEPRHIRPIE